MVASVLDGFNEGDPANSAGASQTGQIGDVGEVKVTVVAQQRVRPGPGGAPPGSSLHEHIHVAVVVIVGVGQVEPSGDPTETTLRRDVHEAGVAGVAEDVDLAAGAEIGDHQV